MVSTAHQFVQGKSVWSAQHTSLYRVSLCGSALHVQGVCVCVCVCVFRGEGWVSTLCTG